MQSLACFRASSLISPGSASVKHPSRTPCDRVRPSYPIVVKYGEKDIGGKRVRLQWELTHDHNKKVRTWKSIVTTNGQEEEFVSYSYLLHHEELVKMLYEVGFPKIEETPIEGECHYNVYIAYR